MEVSALDLSTAESSAMDFSAREEAACVNLLCPMISLIRNLASGNIGVLNLIIERECRYVRVLSWFLLAGIFALMLIVAIFLM